LSTDEAHVRQLAAIARILLGIAYADRRFEAVEYDAIREILGTFSDIDALPQPVVDAIHNFDADSFELDTTVAELAVPEDNRVPLLQMILGVADADAVRDPEEKHYFYAVAQAIGASHDEIEALLAE